MSTPSEDDTPNEDDTPADDTPTDDTPADNDSSGHNSSSESTAGEGRPPAETDASIDASTDAPLTPEEWSRLRAPFSRHAYIVKSRATGRSEANLPVDAPSGDRQEDGSNRAVVDLRLRPEAIRDRLDRVLSPGRYSYRFEPGPEAGGGPSTFCHLRIGPATRAGAGTGLSLRKAGQVALAEAALAFGMGASGQISGPVLAGHESRRELPTSVLDALERGQEPSRWGPGEMSA